MQSGRLVFAEFTSHLPLSTKDRSRIFLVGTGLRRDQGHNPDSMNLAVALELGPGQSHSPA